MTEVEWHEHADAAQMARSLAHSAGAWLAEALTRQTSLTIALSGGRSPWPIYQQLLLQPLPWPRITIVPTDDRLVPANHPLSNFCQLQDCLRESGARMLPLIADASQDPHSAGRAADRQLADIAWPPEWVMLGMGLDGHTASIFPGPDLQQALTARERAVGVLPDPLPAEAPVARVTLTRTAIVAAHRLVVAINGAAKRAVLEQALEQGPASNAPIGQVLAAAGRPVHIHWSPS